MRYPEFYERVPLIRLFDPLGEFLGAFEDGIVDISYLDCVKLAGHSCPTVAGAFLMTYRGLQALYGSGETLPSRSEIMVEIREEKHENVSGVQDMSAHISVEPGMKEVSRVSAVHSAGGGSSYMG